MKNKALFAALLGTTLLFGACGNSDKEEESKPKTEETSKEKEITDNNAVDKSETASSDDDLIEEFNKAEGVTNVNLIVTEDAGGFVLVDFKVVEDMTKEQVEEQANQFAEKVKEKYADYTIDVQVQKNGELFVQKTIEK